jgi:hypothetical protein
VCRALAHHFFAPTKACALICYRALHRLVPETADSRASIAQLDSASDGSEDTKMLWTIFVILLVLWLLGIVSSYTLGGYIHILLVIAIVVLLIRVIQGRNPV